MACRPLTSVQLNCIKWGHRTGNEVAQDTYYNYSKNQLATIAQTEGAG